VSPWSRVDLHVSSGTSHGLVGESGSGKSTLARCVAGIYTPDRGSIVLDGRELPAQRSHGDSRLVQMIFQDPWSSLNPRMTVRSMLRELLLVHRLRERSDIDARCHELLSLVGLPERVLDGYPRQLSGGQRQRVATARALVLEPRLIVADEPTSALDVSVQASVLELFRRLNESLGLTTLFSHNMAVVRQIASTVTVMYLGRIVETAPSETLFRDPRHPYTQILLSAVPRLVPGRKSEAVSLPGDPPSPIDPPPGGRFHTRCTRAEQVCSEVEPHLGGPAKDHVAACHFAW
jgi:oligopeptide/dipeptide ABC transporter ATP-binding protein